MGFSQNFILIFLDITSVNSDLVSVYVNFLIKKFLVVSYCILNIMGRMSFLMTSFFFVLLYQVLVFLFSQPIFVLVITVYISNISPIVLLIIFRQDIRVSISPFCLYFSLYLMDLYLLYFKNLFTLWILILKGPIIIVVQSVMSILLVTYTFTSLSLIGFVLCLCFYNPLYFGLE